MTLASPWYFNISALYLLLTACLCSRISLHIHLKHTLNPPNSKHTLLIFEIRIHKHTDTHTHFLRVKRLESYNYRGYSSSSNSHTTALAVSSSWRNWQYYWHWALKTASCTHPIQQTYQEQWIQFEKWECWLLLLINSFSIQWLVGIIYTIHWSHVIIMIMISLRIIITKILATIYV
jgi:hypothetical protein